MSTNVPVNFRQSKPLETASGVLLPGCESIGMSYDVFDGQYASPDATRKTLFNLGDLEDFQTRDGSYVKYKSVRVQPSERGRVVFNKGNSSNEFQLDRAAKVGMSGSYAFFKGSLDVEFSSNVRSCTAFSFISMTDQFHVYLLSLDIDGGIQGALTDEARQAINDLDPDRLFADYGTHYMQNLFIGATAVFSAAVNTTSISSTTNVSMAAELSYKSLTGQMKGKASASQQQSIDAFNSSSTVKVFAQGGRAEYAHDIANGKYDQWIDSVRTHLAFVDFRNDSLKPLWELCADSTRRDQLQKAYMDYADANYQLGKSPAIVPIYAYHTSSTNPTTSRWYYSQNPDEKPSWDYNGVVFYAFKSQVPGSTPVYLHSASKPERYRLSTAVKGSHGWSDAKKVVFYAFRDRGEGRTPIYQFSAQVNSAQSGWYYNSGRSVKGWKNGGVSFYTPTIDSPGFVS